MKPEYKSKRCRATPEKYVTHFINDSSTSEWLAEMRAMETEGELSPAQCEPSPDALDIFKPAFLRKQAA